MYGGTTSGRAGADEAWAENAKLLAETVTAAAAESGAAELIVVAGDTRARALPRYGVPQS